jgi:single-strand DNA-binding protein
LAELVEKYVHKGDKLYIEGRIRYTTYDDKQGQRRYATEVWADNLELLSPKPSTSADQTVVTPEASVQQPQSGAEQSGELPF